MKVVHLFTNTTPQTISRWGISLRVNRGSEARREKSTVKPHGRDRSVATTHRSTHESRYTVSQPQQLAEPWRVLDLSSGQRVSPSRAPCRSNPPAHLAGGDHERVVAPMGPLARTAEAADAAPSCEPSTGLCRLRHGIWTRSELVRSGHATRTGGHASSCTEEGFGERLKPLDPGQVRQRFSGASANQQHGRLAGCQHPCGHRAHHQRAQLRVTM